MRHGWQSRDLGRRIAASVGLAAALLALAGDRGSGAASSAPPYGSVEVVETDSGTNHLTERPSIPLSPSSTVLAGAQEIVNVDDKRLFQSFHGVGAALTNSSAYLLLGRLPYRVGRQVIENAFGADGMNADYTRVSIGGSDFNQDGTAYTDDDVPRGRTDPGLVHFSLTHDRYMIQALRLALAYHPRLRILASSWSPPAWMKTNGVLNNLGGKGQLKPSDYGVYARYLVKWDLAMKRAGIPIDALSVQNEPNTWTSYPGAELTADQEGTLIRRYLRPDLRAAGLATRIYVTDASWDYESWTARVIPAAGGVGGVFWHCYTRSPLQMTRLHQRYGNVDQVVNECALNLVREAGSQLVIQAARNWASGVNFWNLVLDRGGGPKAPNDSNCGGCVGSVTVARAADPAASALAVADVSSGRVTYNREFYELGQTARFVQSGARRIYSSHSVRYDPDSIHETAGVDNVAFANPDGTIVLEAFNNTYSQVNVGVRARSVCFALGIPARATDTLIWRAAP